MQELLLHRFGELYSDAIGLDTREGEAHLGGHLYVVVDDGQGENIALSKGENF